MKTFKLKIEKDAVCSGKDVQYAELEVETVKYGKPVHPLYFNTQIKKFMDENYPKNYYYSVIDD